MTSEKSYTATVYSTNRHNLGRLHGNVIAGFNIRKHPRYGTDAIFVTSGGLLPCHSYTDCKALIRFDDNQPVEMSASGPQDNSYDSLFFSDYSGIIDGLKNAKKMRIEVLYHSAGSRVFNFNVAGLNMAKLEPSPAEKAKAAAKDRRNAVITSEPIKETEREIYKTAKSIGCLNCHELREGGKAPTFLQIADRYRDSREEQDTLIRKIRKGTAGRWGDASCPPNPYMPVEEAVELEMWISATK